MVLKFFIRMQEELIRVQEEFVRKQLSKKIFFRRLLLTAPPNLSLGTPKILSSPKYPYNNTIETELSLTLNVVNTFFTHFVLPRFGVYFGIFVRFYDFG